MGEPVSLYCLFNYYQTGLLVKKLLNEHDLRRIRSMKSTKEGQLRLQKSNGNLKEKITENPKT